MNWVACSLSRIYALHWRRQSSFKALQVFVFARTKFVLKNWGTHIIVSPCFSFLYFRISFLKHFLSFRIDASCRLATQFTTQSATFVGASSLDNQQATKPSWLFDEFLHNIMTIQNDYNFDILTVPFTMFAPCQSTAELTFDYFYLRWRKSKKTIRDFLERHITLLDWLFKTDYRADFENISLPPVCCIFYQRCGNLFARDTAHYSIDYICIQKNHRRLLQNSPT